MFAAVMFCLCVLGVQRAPASIVFVTHYVGAKSSEDLLGDTAGQTSHTTGEKESFSSNNSTYFLPGKT